MIVMQASINHLRKLLGLASMFVMAGAVTFSMVRPAGAAIYRMSNVLYTWTGGSNTTYTNNTFTGSFEFSGTNGVNGGTFAAVNVVAQSSPDYSVANQPSVERFNFTYDSGYALGFSGTQQKIYLYNSTSTKRDGVELTLNLANALGSIANQTANFTGSTGNDSFCNSVSSYSFNGTKATGGCTSSKNNITTTTGQLTSVVPSPAIAFGLIPFAVLAIKRRKAQNSPLSTVKA